MKNNISSLSPILFKADAGTNAPITINSISLRNVNKIRIKNILQAGGSGSAIALGKLIEAELTKIDKYLLGSTPEYGTYSNNQNNFRILYQAVNKYVGTIGSAGVGAAPLVDTLTANRTNNQFYSDIINVGNRPISAVTFGTSTIFTFASIQYENPLTYALTNMKVGDMIQISGLLITATIAAGSTSIKASALSNVLNGIQTITGITPQANGTYQVTVSLDTSTAALSVIAGATVTNPALTSTSLETQNSYVYASDQVKLSFPPKYVGYVLNLVISYNADLSSLYQTILDQTCYVEIENGGE